MIIKKKLFILLILLFFLLLFFGRAIIKDYYIDNFKIYENIYGTVGGTKTSTAKNFADKVSLFVDYISRCKDFPASLKDFYTPINEKEDHLSCKKVYNQIPSFKIHQIDIKTIQPIWIDPWGRPYQIRYDRENRKLQIRSQGRYLWTELDDIVGETYFDGKMYKAQVEYCRTVPKDDMSCVFNRGWH